MIFNKKIVDEIKVLEKKEIRNLEKIKYKQSQANKFISDVFIKHNQSLENLSGVCLFKRGPFGGSLKKEIFTKRGYKVYEQQHVIRE